jgi:aspartyl-tRNA(Asn)/glutamyl-tRNA(Gln) amidotransferase subunit C
VTISIEEVRHIASLARLGITEERARAVALELSSILEHMQVLSRVETRDLDEESESPAATTLRPDVGPPIPLHRATAAFAPELKDGFFLVPRLATHEDSEPAP